MLAGFFHLRLPGLGLNREVGDERLSRHSQLTRFREAYPVLRGREISHPMDTAAIQCSSNRRIAIALLLLFMEVSG